MVVSDLNFHHIRDACEDLLAVQELTNHVNFPTRIHGTSLDPLLMDLDDDVITCYQVDQVGTSDHNAVLTCINLAFVFEKIA